MADSSSLATLAAAAASHSDEKKMETENAPPAAPKKKKPKGNMVPERPPPTAQLTRHRMRSCPLYVFLCDFLRRTAAHERFFAWTAKLQSANRTLTTTAYAAYVMAAAASTNAWRLLRLILLFQLQVLQRRRLRFPLRRLTIFLLSEESSASPWFYWRTYTMRIHGQSAASLALMHGPWPTGSISTRQRAALRTHRAQGGLGSSTTLKMSLLSPWPNSTPICSRKKFGRSSY